MVALRRHYSRLYRLLCLSSPSTSTAVAVAVSVPVAACGYVLFASSVWLFIFNSRKQPSCRVVLYLDMTWQWHEIFYGRDW